MSFVTYEKYWSKYDSKYYTCLIPMDQTMSIDKKYLYIFMHTVKFEKHPYYNKDNNPTLYKGVRGHYFYY